MMTKDDVVSAISSITHPDKMSLEESSVFLEELISDLQERLDAIKDDLKKSK